MTASFPRHPPSLDAVTSAIALPHDAATSVDAAWHTLEPSVSLRQLRTSDGGLADEEAVRRAAQSGPNEIRGRPPRRALAMLLGQFKDFMIMVLLAAAAVSAVIGDAKDTLAIVVIVVLNAVVGFAQEFRAERAMAALKRMAAATARVVRDGEIATRPAAELVPGDVVLLEAGDVVPADLRLLEAARLTLDESALTGESAAIDKITAAIATNELPLGDRRNIAFKGTIATGGRGRGVVFATGMRTELGRIAELLEAGDEPRTPLQKRLEAFGRRLGLGVIAICAFIFAIGLVRGEPPLLLFLTAVSLAVAAIPEALPAVVTISLALGATKLARDRALIRRLPAVETLGSVTFICSDKTGTLTQNRMRVAEIHCAGTTTRTWENAASSAPWPALMAALALSNDAVANKRGSVRGEATEVALHRAALEAGFDKRALETTAPRALELPFDSERKRMTTVHGRSAPFVAYTKGAPEVVLPRCMACLGASGEEPPRLAELLAEADRMASAGLRVVAVAQREWQALPPTDDADVVESQLVFVGLVGLADPPRPHVAEAVATCASAGITPVMITGDHPATARAIAREVGIARDSDQLLTGSELGRLDDVALAAQVAKVRIYARVDPAQKIRIVEALHRRGEVVAMTGDGVNDAPALRRADIGVAMGGGGTDVAREASSLVLLDDSFATIVSAVREGRRIFDNIRKFIRFVMAGNTGEILTIFLAPIFGLPIPLLPIQILWVNLLTDGLPGLALAAEPAERDVMRRPPRSPNESVFARGLWQHMLWVGVLIGALALAAQAWGLASGYARASTMAFTVLALAQLAHVMAIRSERESLFRLGVGTNRPLLAAVVLTVALQLAAIYAPFLNSALGTEPLPMAELAICLALSGVTFVAVEGEKWLIRRGVLYAPAPR